MLLAKNLKFLDCLFLGTCIKALEKTFLDVLDRKEAFLEIENPWAFM